MISFENFVLSYTYIVKEGLWLNNFGILFLGYILYNLVLLRLRFSATRVLSGSCATRNDEPLSGAWLPAAKDDLTKCTMKHSKGKLVRVFEYKALRSALRPLSTLFFLLIPREGCQPSVSQESWYFSPSYHFLILFRSDPILVIDNPNRNFIQLPAQCSSQKSWSKYIRAFKTKEYI